MSNNKKRQNNSNPTKIEGPLIILCEGKADQAFFRKIMDKRPESPKFSMPFNPDHFHGNGAYKEMLQALQGSMLDFLSLKGILIVADSTDDPTNIFNNICKQIGEAGGYGIPGKPLEIARPPNSNGYPALAVMFLPDETNPGALETLLVQEMIGREPWIDGCVNNFFRCGKIDVQNWSSEKRDKARYHCMVAALNEDDPSKAASYAFKEPTPVIDVTAACFDSVVQRLRDFSTAVGVPVPPPAPTATPAPPA